MYVNQSTSLTPTKQANHEFLPIRIDARYLNVCSTIPQRTHIQREHDESIHNVVDIIQEFAGGDDVGIALNRINLISD